MDIDSDLIDRPPVKLTEEVWELSDHDSTLANPDQTLSNLSQIIERQ